MNSVKLRLQSDSEGVNKDLVFEKMVIHPSLRPWWIYLFGFCCLLAAKLLLVFELPGFEWAWRTTVLVGTMVLLYLFIKRRLNSYHLNAIEIMGREGVFSKRITRIPLNRIANYHSHASLLDRLLGLNSILIDTPGGTGYEMTLKQLCQRDAQLLLGRLRELLAQQKIADAWHDEQLRAQRQQAVRG